MNRELSFDEVFGEDSTRGKPDVRFERMMNALEGVGTATLTFQDRGALRRTLTGIETGLLSVRIETSTFTACCVRSFAIGCGLLPETIVALAATTDDDDFSIGAIAHALKERASPETIGQLIVEESSFIGRKRNSSQVGKKRYSRFLAGFETICRAMGLTAKERQQVMA